MGEGLVGKYSPMVGNFLVAHFVPVWIVSSLTQICGIHGLLVAHLLALVFSCEATLETAHVCACVRPSAVSSRRVREIHEFTKNSI